jgi:hypothetical protein
VLDLAPGRLEHVGDQRGEHMRRHGTRHLRAAAACLFAVGLLGVAGACGGNDSDAASDTTAAPTTSESSSGAAAATTQASPIAGTALDAAITLTTPAQDATVDRSFLVRGSGVAFEGTLIWKLADARGNEAVTGFATAGSIEKQPFQFTVEAPGAGAYTLTVYRESASDGSPADAVTRRLTIR